MKEINSDELDTIKGGQFENVTGPIINALTNIINLLKDAGYSTGSGIRRITEDKLCPLE